MINTTKRLNITLNIPKPVGKRCLTRTGPCGNWQAVIGPNTDATVSINITAEEEMNRLMLLALLLTGCASAPQEPTAQQLIDQLHGANRLMGECVSQECRDVEARTQRRQSATAHPF